MPWRCKSSPACCAFAKQNSTILQALNKKLKQTAEFLISSLLQLFRSGIIIKNFFYDNVKLHTNEFIFDLKKNLLGAKYFRTDANLKQSSSATFLIRGEIGFEILFLLKKTTNEISCDTMQYFKNKRWLLSPYNSVSLNSFRCNVNYTKKLMHA